MTRTSARFQGEEPLSRGTLRVTFVSQKVSSLVKVAKDSRRRYYTFLRISQH